MNGNQRDEIEQLRVLSERLSQLEENYNKTEEEKKKLEALLEIKTSLTELQREAEQANQLSENPTFREQFCKLARRGETILEISEIVTDLIISIVGVGLPVSIPAMVAIRIAKIAVAVYCEAYD